MSAMIPQAELDALVQALQTTEGAGPVETALAAWPEDPRLHFLHGSVLAGDRAYPAARQAMARALDLAPDFAIARFQLGFLEFTSGEPERARDTWRPLDALPPGHALRLFVDGLLMLVRDDAVGAIATLKAGIQANADNPALNGDMQLLIDTLSRDAGTEAPTSETDLLLRQFGASTRH